MTLIVILLTALVSSLFCVGIYIAMEEGMILNFMRTIPERKLKIWNEKRHDELLQADADYDAAYSMIENDMKGDPELENFTVLEGYPKKYQDQLDKARAEMEEEKREIREHYDRLPWSFRIWKPLSMCVTCFASFYGTISWLLVHYDHIEENALLIAIHVPVVAVLNDLIYSRYDKLVNSTP